VEGFSALLTALSALAGSVVAVYGVFRWVPQLWANAKLLAENGALREENKRLRESLLAALASTEAWEGRVESVQASLYDQIEQLQLELADAVIYISTLVASLRQGSNDELPPVPERLKELIARAIAKGESAASLAESM
jgi:hypothetical protein